MRSRYRCSMCPAIHINSRSWLRSSSTHEPSDPPLRMVISFHRFATIVVESHRLVRATDCEPASIRHGAAVTATVFRPSSLLITVTSVEGFVVRLGDRYCGSLNLARLRAPPGRRRPRQVPTVDSCARRKKLRTLRCSAGRPQPRERKRCFKPNGHPNGARRERVHQKDGAAEGTRDPASTAGGRSFTFGPADRRSISRNTTRVSCVARSIKSGSSFVNDPSAGSPTETLLRLLLPLDDQV
jgi:hypothetical protein